LAVEVDLEIRQSKHVDASNETTMSVGIRTNPSPGKSPRKSSIQWDITHSAAPPILSTPTHHHWLLIVMRSFSYSAEKSGTNYRTRRVFFTQWQRIRLQIAFKCVSFYIRLFCVARGACEAFVQNSVRMAEGQVGWGFVLVGDWSGGDLSAGFYVHESCQW